MRVLDAAGTGYASDVIAGIDWVLENKDKYSIRVANFSLGQTVQESVATDPLVQAVEQLWDAGIVVVCSAGNNGRDGYFTITSPGNSPKVITVGSLTDTNTADTSDDSSRPTLPGVRRLGDHIAKPDLVAPGNRIVSLRAATVGTATSSTRTCA